jgi:hypothetical protein
MHSRALSCGWTASREALRGGYGVDPVRLRLGPRDGLVPGLSSRGCQKSRWFRALSWVGRFFAVSSGMGLRMCGHLTDSPSDHGLVMISLSTTQGGTISWRQEHKSFSDRPLENMARLIALVVGMVNGLYLDGSGPRSASRRLVNRYRIPGEHLANTYAVPIRHLSDTRRF